MELLIYTVPRKLLVLTGMQASWWQGLRLCYFQICSLHLVHSRYQYLYPKLVVQNPSQVCQKFNFLRTHLCLITHTHTYTRIFFIDYCICLTSNFCKFGLQKVSGEASINTCDSLILHLANLSFMKQQCVIFGCWRIQNVYYTIHAFWKKVPLFNQSLNINKQILLKGEIIV